MRVSTRGTGPRRIRVGITVTQKSGHGSERTAGAAGNDHSAAGGFVQECLAHSPRGSTHHGRQSDDA